MNGAEKITEQLFSYGTLREASVQLALFGRRLDGQPDDLVGYQLITVRIADQDFVARSGGAENHRAVRFTGLASDVVSGTVLAVTTEELAQADAYEPDGYERALVELKSGAKAWVYLYAHE